jgi:hypothetical protein
MKFSTVTMAFMAAAGAAPGVFASNASPSLRGYDHDNGSGSVGTPVRLLKPDPDKLPAQANTDMPELPPAALVGNAGGKAQGRPFDDAATTTTTTTGATTTTTTTTTAGCAGGWVVREKPYCNANFCWYFVYCPTSAAANDFIASYYDGERFLNNAYLYSIDSDSGKNIQVLIDGLPYPLALSEDGNSFTYGGGTYTISS